MAKPLIYVLDYEMDKFESDPKYKEIFLDFVQVRQVDCPNIKFNLTIGYKHWKKYGLFEDKSFDEIKHIIEEMCKNTCQYNHGLISPEQKIRSVR